MQPFTTVTAVAAPMDLPNIDTDRIIPARFLRKPKGPELDGLLFHDVRFDNDGNEREDFVLNKAPFRNAKVLVVADNFGCGSSREAAVWVLERHGIRSVIAPSLGDIFRENCYKNGLLPVILPPAVVAGLRAQLHATPGATMTVDLESQTVTAPDGTTHRFDVDPFRKQALLSGQDEIALTLGYENDIAAFETRHATAMPWLEPRA
jgi:3-isopropylmalate/(R)-2-methylmalate dehydratase small subunit